MAKITVENVAVTEHKWEGGPSHISISWMAGGKRYHVWDRDPETLFCNPPLAAKRGDSAYFQTRHLDPKAKANAVMLEQARQIAKENNLYEQAIAETDARHAKERSDRLASIIELVKKKHASAMFDALKAVAEGGGDLDRLAALDDANNVLRLVLAEIELEEKKSADFAAKVNGTVPWVPASADESAPSNVAAAAGESLDR